MKAKQLIVVSLLGSATLAGVATFEDGVAYAQDATSGAIQGVVKDQDTGEPLAGVTVVVTGPTGQPQTVISDENGNVLAELYEGLGITTNNVAEYRGLLAALQWAVDHGHTRVHIKADSQLVVQQMLGHYRVKHENLIPLYRQARRLVAQIGHVTFEHVRREQNKEADRLSNLGMDQNA